MKRSAIQERRRTPLRSAAALALAGAATALLGACGGGANANGASSAGKEEQAALKFARCMRAHGVNVSDPKPGQKGLTFSAQAGPGPGPGKGPGNGTPQRLQVSDAACRHLLKGALKPPSGSELNKMRDAALKWARCMRQNGVSVPDPSPGGGGISIEAGKGVRPDNPAFQSADRTCRHLMPGGGPSTQTQGGP